MFGNGNNNHSRKPRFASRKIKAVVHLVRPFTLFAPFIGVFSGGIIALAYYNQLTWPYLSTELPFLI